MSEIQLQDQLSSIQNKLDLITLELDAMKRQKNELLELKNDLSMIASDIFQATVKELDEVSDHIDTGDFANLGKQLIKNTKNISNGLAAIESGAELIEDLKPIGQDLFKQTLIKLDELDKKGYFEFVKGLGDMTDNVVNNFTADDVKALSDNIVTILETVREMTQPHMMIAVKNMFNIFRKMETENIEEYSIWKVMKEMNTPEMKRGIGFMMTFLKHVISEPETKITN